jgi:coenzyme F420 biosynthesis associated uncharacterized protein
VARLIDPRIAATVARRLAGDASLRSSYLMERLVRDLEVAVPRSEELVAERSGIPSPPPVPWGVIDRGDWAEANIAGMSTMLAPLAERLEPRLERLPLPVRIAQQTLVSVEMGVLLGYVSRRVLGQYDVLIPEDHPNPPSRSRRRSREGAALYFVGPNMVETERRWGFVPEEFALWVAVHEVTHRFQFAGVPWLRDRFFGLVRAYLGVTEVDAGSLARRLAGAASRLATGKVPVEERHPAYLLATDEQKEVLNQIQALMAVVEGHGNFVMDSVGERVIPSFKRMRFVFERRREQTNTLQRIINQALGLEMKLRQYELGQKFCVEVAEREGDAGLAYLWTDPEHLPTLSELREPRRWLARVA